MYNNILFSPGVNGGLNVFYYPCRSPVCITERSTILYRKGRVRTRRGTNVRFIKTEDGRLFIGTGEENSDQLEITGKIAANRLLEYCQPANFELALDEDGDSYVKPVLLEQKVTVTEKISRITLTEDVSKNVVRVTNIEELQ